MSEIIAKDSGSTFDYVPAPAGIHVGVLADVVDKGDVPTTDPKTGQVKMVHKIYLTWQLSEKMEDGRPFSVSKQYTLSLHENANLRKDLDKWKGKPGLSPEQRKGLVLDKLIGVNAVLWVKHSDADANGKVWSNVIDIEPLTPASQAKYGQPITVTPDFVRKINRPAFDSNRTAQSTSSAVPVQPVASSPQSVGFPAPPVDAFGQQEVDPFAATGGSF